MHRTISKRFTSLFIVLLALSLIVGFAMRGGTPASAHSAVAHHASVVEVAIKRHHRYHGISIAPSPIQQNDAGKPTLFLVIGRGLTPNGFYDVNLTEFEDRCLSAVLIAPLSGDGTDVQADLEGRFTFTVVIIDCVEGTYSVSVVNDSLSGERHEAHVHVKAA